MNDSARFIVEPRSYAEGLICSITIALYLYIYNARVVLIYV